MDKFYSPMWMARALCEPFELAPDARVFDPTMGEGALLVAAQKHSGDTIQILGCDIDATAVRNARLNHADWILGRANIYSQGSRQNSPIWRSVKQGGVDLVVLNPPFSYRGKQRRAVFLNGSEYQATPAVAALATVLNEVPTAQGIGVVLPEGSFRGEVNEGMWEGIRAHFDVTVVQELPRGSFPDAKASSVLLAVRPRLEAPLRTVPVMAAKFSRLYSSECRCVEVIRGRVYNSQIWDHGDAGAPFVHTTNLIDGGISQVQRFQSQSLATRGPMVLVPRVGRFYSQKIVLVDAEDVVLSDCVIAIRTRDRQQLDAVRSVLLHPATAFERRYRGTGAPYITVRDVMKTIEAVGLIPRHVPASEGAFVCTCDSDLVEAQNVS